MKIKQCTIFENFSEFEKFINELKTRSIEFNQDKEEEGTLFWMGYYIPYNNEKHNDKTEYIERMKNLATKYYDIKLISDILFLGKTNCFGGFNIEEFPYIIITKDLFN